MVKNLKGGKGGKSIARKSTYSSHSESLRLPTCDEEQYACVTKMFGNGMCEIMTNSNVKLVGHIRGAFRSTRNMRSNTITIYSIVLVGMREWENPVKNCDILELYNESQVDQLKNIPKVDIRHVLSIRSSFGPVAAATESEENILFTNETEADYKNLLSEVTEFKMEEENEIDIDEI